MPKIRQKQYLVIDGDYRKKSGILTRSLKNIIKKNISSGSFFKKNTFHNSQQIEHESIPYNDNNTHLFIEKLVNPVIPVEDELKSKSSILHTPNEFDTTLKVQKLTRSRFYDKNLETQFLNESIDFYPYDDAVIENKIDLERHKEKININLKFNNPCRLSLNKNNNSHVTINNQTFIASNSSIVYYNFNDNEWDYLGKGGTDFFESEEKLKNMPLAFNSISPESGKIKIENQSLGIPINTFGFPFDSRYKAMSRHLLKMNSYISKPFILEKVKISFIGTNLSEVENNLNHSILNSLNFFILNQRKNLNENSFTNLNLEEGTYQKANFDTSTGQTSIIDSSIQYDINDLEFFHNRLNTNQPNEGFDVYQESKTDVSYEESQASQRELITYLSLVNFSSGSNNVDNIDYENIKKNADYFYEENAPPDSGYTAKCIFENKTITMSGKVRTPIYYESLESITSENIYPYSKFKSRTGTEYDTERSIKSDFTKSIDNQTTQDENGKEITLGTNIFKENSYTISPKDEIVFGFSFNPSMKFFNNSNYSKDIFMLFNNVKITLIGKYKTKNDNANYTNFNLKNTKKINYYENKNLCDVIGLNNIYLNKGAYFDKQIRQTIRNYPSDRILENYENFYSSAGGAHTNINNKRLFYESNSTFPDYNRLKIDNEFILLEDDNNLEVVNIEVVKLGSQLYFNRKYAVNAKLTNEKKYIFNLSSPTLAGLDIKLSIYSVNNNSNVYYSNSIKYIGTAGTSDPVSGDARIEIEPRKEDQKLDLILFFIDTTGTLFDADGSVLLVKDSAPRNKSFYRYRSFGQSFDKLYEYKFLPYYDANVNKEFYTIEKRFKSIFLEDIQTPTQSYNVDQYSRISVPSPFSDDFLDSLG